MANKKESKNKGVRGNKIIKKGRKGTKEEERK